MFEWIYYSYESLWRGVSSTRRFLWRHRRKFVIGAVLVGGGAWLLKITAKKLDEFKASQLDGLERQVRF